MLEMTYFRAELVGLIVSRSDLDLEVQRYGMKKDTFGSIVLEDELWMRQRENHPQTAKVGFLNTELRKLSFRFLNFEVSSVFRKPKSDIFIRFHTLLDRNQLAETLGKLDWNALHTHTCTI